MKTILPLLFVSLFCAAADAAQTAQARMYCLSLRFQRGHDQNALSTLDLTTLTAGINGELAPLFGAYDQWAWFDLDFIGDVMTGTLNLDLPAFSDANGNGFPDFFEVAQSGSGTSSGAYSLDSGAGGSVQAQWTRNAGSAGGTCRLTLQGFGQFTHSFELIEYSGPLMYTPGSNTVSGSVDLTQTGNSANQFQGPVTFFKNSTNRFNELTLQPGAWTNAAMETLTFLEDDYLHDSTYPTNYYGYFDFDDGDLSTGEPDYYTWLLSIDDPNDADNDGIPDLSDDPQIVLPPRRPRLALNRTPTNLLLSISGDVGRLHQIQGATSLTSPNWSNILSVTLTNDPQTVSLPIPAEMQKFWRALVP